MEKTRCPNCGALNVADAQWCNQCLTRFVAPEPPPPPPAVVEAGSDAEEDAWWERASVLDANAGLPDPLVAHQAATAPPAQAPPMGTPLDFKPPDEAVGRERGAFKIKSEGVMWTCSVCDSENPLSASLCSVCGTSFATALKPPKRTFEDKDAGTATLWSLFIPGAGHAYLGLWAQAWARGILSFWVILIVLISALQKGVPGANTIPILFGAIAFFLWVVNAHDAFREAVGVPSQVILKGRMFVWVVLGILGLLMLMLFTAAMQARG
jgi:hypothetical protein